MTKPTHPQALWLLAFGKLWDTFSYYGTQTVLTLYFIHIFHLQRDTSYLLYGAYAAFAFSIPTFGGMLADRWLGSKQTLLIGSLLNIAGNLMLVSLHRYLFCLGLATTLIGSGLYKSNATHLIGTLYKKHDTGKEQGFTLFYLAINIGGVLGPLVYGFVIYHLGWNYSFLFSAFGILIGMIWFLKNWALLSNKENSHSPITQSTKYLLGIGIFISCLLLSLPFYFYQFTTPIICILFAISLVYLINSIRQYTGTQRRHLFALLWFCFFAMFYFAAGLQIGTTVILFIQQKIHQGAINTQLPASTFSMLYCLFVLLLAPITTFIWRKQKARGIILSAPTKLIIGIGLATLGIGAFALAAITPLVIINIIIGYLLLSAGELVITPAAYTMISNLSPNGMKSTMMGCWLLFVAVGGYLSGLLANASHRVSAHLPFASVNYFGEFLFIALFTLLTLVIVVIARPRLIKMMR